MIGQFVNPDLDNLALQPLEARDSITVVQRADLIGQRFEAPNLSNLLGEPRFAEPADVRKQVEEIRAKAADLLALKRHVME